MVRGPRPAVLTGGEQLQSLPPERDLTLMGIGETDKDSAVELQP